MADSIDTYIVSEIFLFFISRYRKNLSGIFQRISLPKVQTPLPLTKRMANRAVLLSGSGDEAMESRLPGHRSFNFFYISLLTYAIIVTGVNMPSDSR